MKKFVELVVFIFTGKGNYIKDVIENGVVNYGGQGRDEYGN